MKPSRRLALRREALTELTCDELALAVAGAAPTLRPGCSVDDVNAFVEDLYWQLSVHQHCTWTCI